MFVFGKIWHALFSWNIILRFALLLYYRRISNQKWNFTILQPHISQSMRFLRSVQFRYSFFVRFSEMLTFSSVLFLFISQNLTSNITSTKPAISFYVLAQFLFITSEMKQDYYHHKLKVRVLSRVAERLKT